jgi:hypothetical protein
VRIRNANGQVRQSCTITSDQKLSCPISQNGREPARCRDSSSWFTMPVSRWSMNVQVMSRGEHRQRVGDEEQGADRAPAAEGPLGETAAAMPNSQATARTMTV